mmetsp:Transcript_5871/g.13905  ORF Transcript_5871/g.13905 Transcript_5871/m.13905 type:complete len:418 (+) Transcript_5871:30-1283(+)
MGRHVALPPKHWVLIETASGHALTVRERDDGTPLWEANPADLPALLSRSRVLQASDCRVQRVTARELCQRAARSSGPKEGAAATYAQRLFSVAGDGRAKAEEEEAAALKSHSGGLPFCFDPGTFSGFDVASLSARPVEPVDSDGRCFGGRCLALAGTLTEAECEFLIREMGKDMEPVRYRLDYRRNSRCIYESRQLAELLWQRIRHVAAELSVHVDAEPAKQRLLAERGAAGDCPEPLRVGIGREGVWDAVGLNECLRFCHYSPGGFFRAHCDGSFRRSSEELSLFTCMFYLNGGLAGGTTRFVLNGERCWDEGLRPAMPNEVLASVAPSAGLCLLFFQPGLLHEGEELLAGDKYILRTDVMFRRRPGTQPERTPEQKQAMELLCQAQAAEEEGSCSMAAQLYRRAFKLDPRLERML